MNTDRETIPLTVLRMRRLQNTVNGGSRFRIITNGGELYTQSDSAMVGTMDPWMEGRTFVFTLNRVGRVWDFREVN